MFKVVTAMEALRKHKNMSQGRLGQMIQKTQAEISHYENLTLTCPEMIRQRIAQALEYNGPLENLLKPYYEVFGPEGPTAQKELVAA